MWINQGSMPIGKEFQDCWDLVIKGECDEVARHAGLKNWDDLSEDIFDLCPTPTSSTTKQSTTPSSTALSTPKKQQKLSNNGILTPSSSNDEASSKGEIPPSKPGVNTLTNPASKGLPISALVNKNKNPTQAAAKKSAPKKSAPKKSAPKKAATSNKKGRPAKEQTSKINLPVTKSNSTATGKKSVPNSKPESSKPMQTVPPSAARNNGPAAPSNYQSQKNKDTNVPMCKTFAVEIPNKC
jgi:NAD-dependent histone deacetylase SIR2